MADLLLGQVLRYEGDPMIAGEAAARHESHGAVLVDRVLSGNLPLLAVNALSTASERSEQSGFANLVRGTFGMFRNPTAHEARINWPMTKEDAEDLLSLVSLIHRRLDAAVKP